MNICVKCDYHHGDHVPTMDYHNECHVKKHPVTGKPMPQDCEVKNPDGKCSDYKGKGE